MERHKVCLGNVSLPHGSRVGAQGFGSPQTEKRENDAQSASVRLSRHHAIA